jgi:hypothetical protein
MISYDHGNRGENRAKSVVADYPVKRPVTVYYKPGSPGVSVLEKGIFESTYEAIYIGYGLIIFSLVYTVLRLIWTFFRGG